MCTLSWILNKQGYEVFFNRDEQRTRAKAIAPVLDNNNDTIMPIDPQGKGTWIACNLHGMTLCLLNNYQKQADMNPDKDYLSRGQLIPRLIQQNIDPFDELKTIKLENYLPFFICIFPAELNKNSSSISIIQWDGNRLTEEPIKQPFISSAVLLPQVKKTRREFFTQFTTKNDSSQQHLAYHASHLPEKGHASVCMHREDACTQSLSHIKVAHDICFAYHDGPPCKNNLWSEIKTEKCLSLE